MSSATRSLTRIPQAKPLTELQPEFQRLHQRICAPSSAKAAPSQVAGAVRDEEKGGDHDPLAIAKGTIVRVTYELWAPSLANRGLPDL